MSSDIHGYLARLRTHLRLDENIESDLVRELAAHKGATAGQVALAWLLHKGTDIIPIPGTKRRRYLEENVKAADVTLSDDEMSVLDTALAPDRIAGPRYSEQNFSMIDR